MTRLTPLLFLPLGACLPGFPAPSHLAAMTPAAGYRGEAVEVTAAVTFAPSLGASYVVPWKKHPWLLVDGQFQGGATHAQVNPGVWFASRPGQDGGHFGTRLGVIAGTGDILGLFDFVMPYAGGNLVLQYAYTRAPGGIFSVSLSGDAVIPLFEMSRTYTDSDGTEATAVALPNAYVGLDLRDDIRIGDRTFLVLGIGVDYGVLMILPEATVGLRF